MGHVDGKCFVNDTSISKRVAIWKRKTEKVEVKPRPCSCITSVCPYFSHILNSSETNKPKGRSSDHMIIAGWVLLQLSQYYVISIHLTSYTYTKIPPVINIHWKVPPVRLSYYEKLTESGCPYLRSDKKLTRVNISADIKASSADCVGESKEYCLILEPPPSMLSLRSLVLGEKAGSGLALSLIRLISTITSRLAFRLPPCKSRMAFFTSAKR